ncbi:hypothetical protein CEP51_016546, partial [Fusarium floridanum]
MDLVPKTAFRPHALNPTLLNNAGGVVTETPRMPRHGDLVIANSLSLDHTVNPALLHDAPSTETVTVNHSSFLEAWSSHSSHAGSHKNDDWGTLTKGCENAPAEVKAKSPGDVVNAPEQSRRDIESTQSLGQHLPTQAVTPPKRI